MKGGQINSKLTKLYPYFAWLFLPILIVATFQKFNNPIWSDSEGYYIYLPGTFIYDGFDADMPFRTPGFFAPHTYSNKIYTKYTYGIALMQSPFFFGAHAIVTNGWFNTSKKNNDGYYHSYQEAICLAAVFYCFLGLWFLQKALDRYFSPKTVIFTLIAVLFGTNLYHYTISEPGMSHAYSFCLFAAVVYFTPKALEQPNVLNLLALGFSLSLAALIRPTNIILSLYPIFSQIYSWEQMKDRLQYFQTHWLKILLIPLISFIILIPQLIYWKYISGHFILYSYGNEGFIYWNAPKILNVWFHVQNGLFIYSPIMVFGIVGLVLTIRKKVFSGPIIGLLFLLASYIFASWWAWWFGGAFGHRCFVEYFALLTIPLAYFISTLLKWTSWLKYLIISLMAVMILYTLRLTYIYFAPWDGSEWGWGKFLEVLAQDFF